MSALKSRPATTGEINPLATKKCGKCKKHKDLSEFSDREATKSDGLQSWCKGCIVETQEATAIRNARHVQEYLKTHHCVTFGCGQSNPWMLDFDHIDRSTKYKSVSQLVKQGASIAVINEEIAKCQILCANCHRMKTAEEGRYNSGIIDWDDPFMAAEAKRPVNIWWSSLYFTLMRLRSVLTISLRRL